MAVVPTKGNLIAARRSLGLARTGYDLMDRKRNILIREMMGLIDKAGELQSEIDSTFSNAYESLQRANITLGIIDQIAQAVPEDESVGIRTRSVMGVEIPSVRSDSSDPKAPYGFPGTNAALDKAFIQFHNVRRLCTRLAETENTIYRLAYAIKKTQKRANALQNIIIPGFERDIKFIVEALEEREREEYSRLKVIKTRV